MISRIYQIKGEKKYRASLFFEGWKGYEGIPPKQSINKYRIAVRLATTQEWKYDCWVPDPDFDDCCMHLLIDEEDIVKRFINSKNIIKLSHEMEVGITEFCDLPMIDKLYKLTLAEDILDFLGIEDDILGVPIDDIKLERKITKDAFRVKKLDECL